MNNGILTEADAALFIAALDDVYPGSHDVDDCVDTRDTLADFVSLYGPAHETDTAENGVTLHRWNAVQNRKGEPRRDITIAELASGTAFTFYA